MVKKDPRQPSLFDLGTDIAPSSVVTQTGEGELVGRSTMSVEVASAGPQMDYRQSLLEQVMRDRQTLTMGSDWWIPSREFFVERIEAYSEDVRKI